LTQVAVTVVTGYEKQILATLTCGFDCTLIVLSVVTDKLLVMIPFHIASQP
jgi:hypothetical protein